MEYKFFYGISSSYYTDALYIRYKVFSQEQGFDPSIDSDLFDRYSWHVLAIDKKTPIGTARIHLYPSEESYKIGRVCVLKKYRNKGIGKQLIDILIHHAKYDTAYDKICLSSQVTATKFYEKTFFFKKEGEQYIEDGQRHIKMILKIKRRGFEKISYLDHNDIIIPRRNTKYSAGYDLYTYEDITIKSKSIGKIKTGVKSYMLKDEVLEIYIRSSIAIRKNLNLVNNVGIIDSDYYNNLDNEGHIMILAYNYGDKDILINKGEKIAQGIFKKYLITDNDKSLSNINNKRSGGFGSTGK